MFSAWAALCASVACLAHSGVVAVSGRSDVAIEIAEPSIDDTDVRRIRPKHRARQVHLRLLKVIHEERVLRNQLLLHLIVIFQFLDILLQDVPDLGNTLGLRNRKLGIIEGVVVS